MSREHARAIDAALGGVPQEDRVIALAASLVTRRHPARAVASLIALATVMGKYLEEPDRIGIAELMRDGADQVEHAPVSERVA